MRDYQGGKTVRHLVTLFSVLFLAVPTMARLSDATQSDLEPGTQGYNIIQKKYSGCAADLEKMTGSQRQECFYYLDQIGKIQKQPEPDIKTASISPTWRNSARVAAIAHCNPKDGKFYLGVYLDGKLWNNPYDPADPWLTSPGLQAWDKEHNLPMQTLLDNSKYGSKGNHVRGVTRGAYEIKNKEYTGKMFDPVWIGSEYGFAVHGTYKSNYDKLGYPASHGCLRLKQDHALQFRELVDYVGHNNASVYFAGYQCDERVADPLNPKKRQPRKNFLEKIFGGGNNGNRQQRNNGRPRTLQDFWKGLRN